MLALVLVCLLLPAGVLAEPAPFGLEIGKATIKEVTSKYNAKSAGTNKYSQGEMYDLDVSQLSFEGLQSARVVFSSDGKLLAILCKLPKSKFKYLFDSLKGKYKLVNSKVPFVGDTSAKFSNGNTQILLDSPHMSFEMDMNYIHNSLIKAYEAQSKAEQQQKKKRESSQL